MSEENPDPVNEIEEDIADFDLTLKKKKKKKKVVEAAPVENEEIPSTSIETTTSNEPSWAESDRDYDFTELLDRVFTQMRARNPNYDVRQRHVMPIPQLIRVGAKKTMWANFAQIMHRQTDHVYQFFMSELATEGSIDANQRLIIKGRYAPKQIESLLKKYIIEYVTCHMCRSPGTVLSRDSVTRLYFVKCETCKSTRSVAPIKAGFHATSRADRRAARS